MGLFDGDTVCRFCRMETETVQHVICCCEALAREGYNAFGRLTVELKGGGGGGGEEGEQGKEG